MMRCRWWLVLLPASALAQPLVPASVTASSTYPADSNVSYSAKQLLDGQVRTAWVEGDRGSGLGAFVQIELGETKEVRGLRLWNGYWASSDLWVRHNRIKDLELTFSDGSKLSFTLKDAQLAEAIMFPKPVSTSSIKLKLKSVYPGTTFGDTPLAELQVFDTAPDSPQTPGGVKASSTYPADADADYGVANLVDGLRDTMWCEGDKQGDGTGQTLDFTFPAATSIGNLRVYNGNAASPEENAGANQPTAVTLTFDDGATEPVALLASPDLQVLSFPAHTTTKLRLTVVGVAKGTAYNDLCVSELQFGP